MWDKEGNKYLEGLAGLWCTALGYGNQELIDTTTEQMSKLTFSHMFGGKTHQVAIDLADKLADMIPMQDAVLSFGNSGSDANDTHIKLLRYYHEAIGKPERRKIIARERSYHGVTVAAASLTGCRLPKIILIFQSMPWVFCVLTIPTIIVVSRATNLKPNLSIA